MGSPRHQTPTSQQSPLHKSTTQQGPKTVHPQPQKTQMGTGVSGPSAPMAGKQPTDAKSTTPATAPVPTMDAQKQTKPTEEKPKTEPENETAKETKPLQKKGEQITPVKEIKKSKQHEVRLIFFSSFKFHLIEDFNRKALVEHKLMQENVIIVQHITVHGHYISDVTSERLHFFILFNI